MSTPDLLRTIVAATEGLDIGMMMYCAGADPYYEPFLANPVDVSLALVQRNCVVAMQVCHHFAGPMATRGTGGIVLVSSGAGLLGSSNIVAYSATKAFDMVMAEGLWSELHAKGVDVLGLVLGVTDTPALRQLLARRGNLARADDGTPIPGAATPTAVAAEAIANLANGPTWFVGEQLRDGAQLMGAMPRSDAVKMRLQHGAGIMDTQLSAPDA